ncbi:MAG: hypothetical protein CMJ81_19200 [Planctomycetaceae bacterium]|nr:hypothetical protein [Planctomycetaceae bacterium]
MNNTNHLPPKALQKFVLSAVPGLQSLGRSSLLIPLLLISISGCSDFRLTPKGDLDRVWGRRGISDGRFQKPRAMTIDSNDLLYTVDMTARIQVFNADGEFLTSWQTPLFEKGKPSGLSIDRHGNLLVADTHYHRMLVYSPLGELLPEKTIGGKQGQGPGEFGFVTDAVQDSQGFYYVAEYGEYDRIQKFTPEGKFSFQWGGHGTAPGKFLRPQNLALDKHDHLWVADACNHRIQVFDARGDEARLVRSWGQQGSAVGQLNYPYDLVLDHQGHVYVCEFGNHRIQKFTVDGQSCGIWGTPGRGEGELHSPWALVQDSLGRIHILDTMNHRVQRIRM